VYVLSCHGACHFCRIGGLYPPGQPMTAVALRDTIRETLCLGKSTSREVHRGYKVP